MKHELKIAKISTIIVFLALIRTIIEPLRLFYGRSISEIPSPELIPYIIGALFAAVGLFISTIFYYYGKTKFVIAVCVLVIIALVVVKYWFNLK
ncbi:MAG: hypothetical protein K0S32_1051 [Bacteroidetes bacterium]|jgi:hypothetical protein|nr:hypothetical protein [Bacteroidota bacterium]